MFSKGTGNFQSLLSRALMNLMSPTSNVTCLLGICRLIARCLTAFFDFSLKRLIASECTLKKRATLWNGRPKKLNTSRCFVPFRYSSKETLLEPPEQAEQSQSSFGIFTITGRKQYVWKPRWHVSHITTEKNTKLEISVCDLHLTNKKINYSTMLHSSYLGQHCCLLHRPRTKKVTIFIRTWAKQEIGKEEIIMMKVCTHHSRSVRIIW